MAAGHASAMAGILHHPGDANTSKPESGIIVPGNVNEPKEKGPKSTGVILGQFYKYVAAEIEDEQNY